jgi:hypothetical protein
MEEKYRRSSAGNVIENFGVVADDFFHAEHYMKIDSPVGKRKATPRGSPPFIGIYREKRKTRGDVGGIWIKDYVVEKQEHSRTSHRQNRGHEHFIVLQNAVSCGGNKISYKSTNALGHRLCPTDL